jgi:predicted transcriptional regulator
VLLTRHFILESIIAMPTVSDVKSEDRLIPLIRAKLAEKLIRQGFHVKEIADALRVTQPAVTQYIKKRRGVRFQGIENMDILVDPLAEKLAGRIRSGLGGIETAELLETARQVLVVSRGRKKIQSWTDKPRINKSVRLLKARLQLELTAAENYLELAGKTSDDYTKLLLRMIASDSIRHGDVVSQIISWLEAGRESEAVTPELPMVEKMLSLEDSASEISLKRNIEIDHSVARLLLEWIDMDEEKHEKILNRLLSLKRLPSRMTGSRTLWAT